MMPDPLTQNSVKGKVNQFNSLKQMNMTSSRGPVKFLNPLQSPNKVFFSTQTSPRRYQSPLPPLEKEETYNPLKLPRHETYEPYDKEAYYNSLSMVGSKVGSFRQINPIDNARQQRFIDDEDKKFEDNPLYDSKAGNSNA